MRRLFTSPALWPLGTRVAVAAGVLLAVLLVLLVLTHQRTIDDLREAELANSRETGAAVAGIVDGFARDLETAMLAVSLALGGRQRPINQETTGAELHALHARYGVLRALFVTDAEGVIVASASGDGLGRPLGERPYMQSLLGGAEEVWGPGVAGLASGEITATYGRTILAPDGALRGYLIAAFYPVSLAERLRGSVDPDAGVTIVDNQGFVLLSTRQPDLPTGQRDLSSQPLVRAALGGEAVQVEQSPLLGEDERFGVIQPVATTGWAVAYTRPWGPLEAGLREQLTTQLAQVAIAVIVVGALLALATQRITRPLARLAAAAGEVAEGKRPGPLPVGGGAEVAQLAAAMEAMSNAVAEREAALRRESERRTKLGEASRAFTEAILNLEAETDTVARRVAEAVGDGCAVMLLSDDRASLLPVTMYHPRPDSIRLVREALADRPLPVKGSTLGRVVSTGEPLFAPRVTDAGVRATSQPAHVEYFARLGIRSLIAAALAAHGEPIGTLVVWRDSDDPYTAEDLALVREIADRGALAIENARLFERVAQHAAAVERAAETQEEFMALVSHDLRNPLTTIGGAAQLLQRRLRMGDHIGRDRLTPILELIESSVDKASQEIDSFLDLSRARAGRSVPLHLAPVDVVALARTLAAGYARSAPRHTVRVETDAERIEGQWDGARLERVLANLLDNAVKFSPDGGTVTLAIAREDRGGDPWVVLRVTDQGIGIPEGERARIFERFYRAENAMRRVPGTGLGLSSVALIVEGHGGTIEVESVEGAGSTFTVRLPLVPPNAGPADATPAEPVGEGQPGGA